MFGEKRIRVLGVCLVALFFLTVVVLVTQNFLAKRRIERLEELNIQCGEFAVLQDWESLESSALEWVKLDKSAADAWLNLAESHQKQGRPKESVDCLLKVPRNDPKASQALLFAAEMQLAEAGQPSGGIDTLRELRDIDPRNDAARKHLISLYAMTLQRREMIDEIRDAFRYHVEPPEAYMYLMIADHLSFTNGAQLNTRWLAAESGSELYSVARVIQLVDTLKKLEKTSPETEIQRHAGEEELNSLLKKYPQNRALLYNAIESAMLEEDVDQVRKLLAQIRDPDFPDSLSLRYKGWHLMKTQRPQEAEEAYRRSISLMPLDWHAWHELASALRNQGKLEAAESAARIAVVGKELRKECLALPDASQAPPDLFDRILQYAVECRADDVAAALSFRKQPTP